MSWFAPWWFQLRTGFLLLLLVQFNPVLQASNTTGPVVNAYVVSNK